MAEFFVQGKKGAGKSITAVGRIQEYLQRGRPVATNLDLNLEHLVSPFNRTCEVYRIPDQPRIEDLEILPNANDSYDEENNGALVFDECATWFNSRSWNDKARKPVIDWLLHARKRGWDVYYLVQDVSAIDSQARETMMEHCVTCKRTDRLNIPGIGTLFKLFTGHKLPMPKGHAARVEYTDTKLVVDRWFMRGDHLYQAYDTKQIFSPTYIAADEESGVAGVYQVLPPYFTHGYRMLERNREFYMRLSKLYFEKLKAAIYVASGAVATGLIGLGVFIYMNPEPQPEPVTIIEEETSEQAPVYRSLSLVGHSLIGYQRGPIKHDQQKDYYVTDGTAKFSISDLKALGYQHQYISECYHMLTDTHGNRIPVTCNIPGESGPSLAQGRDTFINSLN